MISRSNLSGKPGQDPVLTFEVGDEAVAIPFDRLSTDIVVQTAVGGVSVGAFWQPGTSAALDASTLRSSRDIGAAGAFRAEIEGAPARFETPDGLKYETATGRRWNVLGTAVEGPLTDTRLEPVVSGTHFWFIWSVFKPDTSILVE